MIAWAPMTAMPIGDHRGLVIEVRDAGGHSALAWWTGRLHARAPVSGDIVPIGFVPFEQRPLRAAIVELLLEVLGCGRDRIEADALLVGDLGADSLDLVDLQWEIETRWEIRLDDDLFGEGLTVDRLEAALTGSEGHR